MQALGFLEFQKDKKKRHEIIKIVKEKQKKKFS